MQFLLRGVLTGESCIGDVGQYFNLDEMDPRSESTILSTTVFIIILSAHHSS